MNFKKLQGKKWYPHTVAACIAVTLYVALSHLGSIWAGVRGFLGYFSSVYLGCVLAYLVNPLAMLYQRTLFCRIRKDSPRWSLSVGLALMTVLLFLLYFAGTLVPQLVDSASGFVGSLDGYVNELRERLSHWDFAEHIGLMGLLDSYESGVNLLLGYLSDNLSSILNASVAAGKSVFSWAMALILSVYLLAAKDTLQQGARRLLRAASPAGYYKGIMAFFARCNAILNRYIIYSLLDSAIVGLANALFMQLMGMQYTGLVSIAVAVMNLIPTFGPVIGAMIGALVLLLVRPLHALLFLGFTLLLQFLDGYIIKPRLFGKSLGVSGLLIMVAVIVGGKMFGVVGILLSIPIAAILDFVYSDYLLPALEKRKASRTAEEEG